jgi:hypothetical protein
MSQNQSQPADEMVYPEQVTRDFLYGLFASAYLNVHRDSDGDVYLKDAYTLWVFPQQEGEQIRLMAQFKTNSEAPRSAKLEYVNGINDGLKLLRAYVDADDDIGFDYFIGIEGGITKRNIVLSVRRFINYLQVALQRDEQGVIG